MTTSRELKPLILLVGDAVVFYTTLLVVLWVRYGHAYYQAFVDFHVLPFSILFAMWVLVFYIAGLYTLARLRNSLDFLKTLALSIFVNMVLAVLFFYLIPIFNIAPKTNLFLLMVIFGIAEVWWRRLFNRLIAGTQSATRVLLLGNGKTAGELMEAMRENPQLGYEIALHIPSDTQLRPEEIERLVKEHAVQLVIIPRHLKRDSALAKLFYSLLVSGLDVRELPHFYENVFRSIPVEDIEESWFLENIVEQQKFYDQLKRAGELLAALLLQVILLPLETLIAIAIKLTSRGPVIYAQKRVGRHGNPFTLYKFRTMRVNAEASGAQWAKQKDPRATPVGQLLRYSHLDELPQLVNILEGNLSFVGPRPERPEFVAVLKDKVPYYNIRHIITPGVTGWAQINYRKDETTEDVIRKVQYDLYYLKNRSLIFDLAILARTVKSFFINQS